MIRAILLGAMLFATPAVGEALVPAEAAQMMEVATPGDFVNLATFSNLFELKSSSLAEGTSKNAEIVSFADLMMADHSVAADEMLAAATEEGISPPTELNRTHQDRMEELNRATGDLFDGAYVAAQVQEHEEAVALFKGYIANGPDGPLKDFAVRTLPKLQVHLNHVAEIVAE